MADITPHITPDDLRAAVAAGTVTEAQAASLLATAHARAGAANAPLCTVAARLALAASAGSSAFRYLLCAAGPAAGCPGTATSDGAAKGATGACATSKGEGVRHGGSTVAAARAGQPACQNRGRQWCRIRARDERAVRYGDADSLGASVLAGGMGRKDT